MNPRSNDRTRQILAGGLLVMGVIARLLPHPPNVTPLTAIALFGGTALSKRWAILLPLAIIVLSDLALGLHDVVAFTWGSVGLIGFLGLWIRKRPGARRIACAALIGSTIFFVVTNFGVWLVGDGGTMYPKTWQGLVSCYVAALPFYRNALVGDLVWTLSIFGLYAWATKHQPLQAMGRAR